VNALSAQTIDLAVALRGLVSLPSFAVENLCLDSRNVRPGDAFIAVAGRTSHGLSHAGLAVERGAIAVLHDPADGVVAVLPMGVKVIAVPRLATHLGEIADRAYGAPSASVEVAGVTGTNGKTTCAWLYALSRDSKAAYLGTLGAGRPPHHLASTTHTTGDVLSVHRMLADFRDAGVQYVGMEVSSHALDQGRVAAVQMPIVAFTNLTRDHLDYHGSMTAYGAAKERLLSCLGVRDAVINIDDPFGAELAMRLPVGVAAILTSTHKAPPTTGRSIYATHVDCHETGLCIRGRSYAGEFELQSPLVGSFNAENLLIVLGLLLASGVALREAVQRLAGVPAPPGRMEAFAAIQGPLVVVDYAHTPDALDKALVALRRHVRGNLYCVFGCGGDRDPGKRSLMAQVAEARADHVVVTDDNPRHENPDQIIAMILAAFSSRCSVRVERDRATAIRSVYAAAQSGDVVLIAGKGHEDYQIYGDDRRHFSDRQLSAELTKRAA